MGILQGLLLPIDVSFIHLHNDKTFINLHTDDIQTFT